MNWLIPPGIILGVLSFVILKIRKVVIGPLYILFVGVHAALSLIFLVGIIAGTIEPPWFIAYEVAACVVAVIIKRDDPFQGSPYDVNNGNDFMGG
jgi:hypothetical protein